MTENVKIHTTVFIVRRQAVQAEVGIAIKARSTSYSFLMRDGIAPFIALRDVQPVITKTPVDLQRSSYIFAEFRSTSQPKLRRGSHKFGSRKKMVFLSPIADSRRRFYGASR